MANDFEFFHVSVSHLYVFFGKVSVHIFCAFYDLFICFSCIEFEKFFVDLGYQSFIRSIICKYILPFHGLPLSFFFIVSLAVQKLFILMKSHKFIFSLVSLAFGDVSWKRLLWPMS